MSQKELDQLLANQTESAAKITPSTNPEPIDADDDESQEKDASSTNDNRPPNYNPYAYPPPSLGMPFGSFPRHLMPHMAQMMQNGFPGFGSAPPPAHLLRFMMPPFVNQQVLSGGKTLETLQTELRKV